jgi:undecaprenyl-diphosphatase
LTLSQGLILGIVQGFTEFLPVSSSGHLVLVPEFFNIPAPTIGFDILLHLATLVAVLGYFIGDVRNMLVALFAPAHMERGQAKFWRRLLLWLVIGSVPAGIAGVAFGGFFEGLFSSTLAVGIFLIVTGCLLYGADLYLAFAAARPRGIPHLNASDSLIVGCFQALAIAPGLSRSGATIAGGTYLGLNREAATRFSFLLSIPAILGATLIKMKDVGGAFTGASGGALALGALAALVSGVIAVYFLLRYLRNHRLRVFAIYALILGVFVVILSLA